MRKNTLNRSASVIQTRYPNPNNVIQTRYPNPNNIATSFSNFLGKLKKGAYSNFTPIEQTFDTVSTGTLYVTDGVKAMTNSQLLSEFARLQNKFSAEGLSDSERNVYIGVIQEARRRNSSTGASSSTSLPSPLEQISSPTMITMNSGQAPMEITDGLKPKIEETSSINEMLMYGAIAFVVVLIVIYLIRR